MRLRRGGSLRQSPLWAELWSILRVSLRTSGAVPADAVSWDRAWTYAGSGTVRSVPARCQGQGVGRGMLTMANPDIAPDVQAVIKQVLRVVGDFTHTHADPSDWLTIVASVSSTLLTYMAQRTHMMPDEVDAMLDAALSEIRDATWRMLQCMDSATHEDDAP